MMNNKFFPKLSGNNFLDILMELKLRGKTTSFLNDKDILFFEDLLKLMNITFNTNKEGGIDLKIKDKDSKFLFNYYVSMMQKFFESKEFNFPKSEEYLSRKKMLIFTLCYFDIEYFEENIYSVSLMKPLDKGIYI